MKDVKVGAVLRVTDVFRKLKDKAYIVHIYPTPGMDGVFDSVT